MNMKRLMILMLSLVIIGVSYYSIAIKNTITKQTSHVILPFTFLNKDIRSHHILIEEVEYPSPISSTDGLYQINKITYRMDHIDASYPQVVSGATQENINEWNDIILSDFNKILDLYSYQPYPELSNGPTQAKTSNLTIDYTITLLNDQF